MKPFLKSVPFVAVPSFPIFFMLIRKKPLTILTQCFILIQIMQMEKNWGRLEKSLKLRDFIKEGAPVMQKGYLRLLIAMICILLPMVCIAEEENIGKKADIYFNEGYQSYFKNDLDDAILKFSKAIELNPTRSNYHLFLGKTFQKKGIMHKAIDELKFAVEIEPDLTEAHVKLGECLYSQGLWSDAEKAFLKVIKLKPDDFEGYYKIGQVYIKSKKVDDAVSNLLKAKDMNPEEPNIPFYLGQAYLEKDEIFLAISEFGNAICYHSPGKT